MNMSQHTEGVFSSYKSNSGFEIVNPLCAILCHETSLDAVLEAVVPPKVYDERSCKRRGLISDSMLCLR